MKNKSTLVSVILPTFNASRFLSRTILSVLNQSYRNIELIIVDDCSKDQSLKLIKKFAIKDKRIKYFKTQKNSGSASVPKNLGISKASGKYLAFIDADDYWMLDKLEYQMLRISNYWFSFTAANYQKEISKKKSNFMINAFRIFLQIFFINRVINYGNQWIFIYNPFLMSSAIIKKNVLDKNIFNTDLNIREDLTLWLNVFKKYNKKIVFHPKILVTITRTKNSITSDRVLEFNKIINSISNFFLSNQKKKNFKYFIFGIILRFFKNLISLIYSGFRKNIIKFSILYIIFYFIIYYTPLFWLLGQKLIINENSKKTEAVFVLSGHKGFDDSNDFIERFNDIQDYLKKYKAHKDTKFFLLGKLSSIPNQKILEAFLLKNNVEKNNIHIIYKEYNSSYLALKLLDESLREFKLSSVSIISSPYHSLRLKNLWNAQFGSKYDTVFFKNVELPKKNNFFERSFNKKEIIFEILANFHNKILYKH
jgi:teichuronic acid biosynthesis glycosyltransferase TuaG